MYCVLFSSFPALLHQLITTKVNHSNPFAFYVPFRTECIFLPDSGALFINYVVTCALLGTGLRILRLGHIFQSLVRRHFYAHTVAERKVFSEVIGFFIYDFDHSNLLPLFP